MIPGQGYNVALPPSPGLRQPVIFEEVHAVATPFDDRIRLGGTMEFGGDHPPFDQRRVDMIVASMKPFLDLEWDQLFDTWAGSRPMSADGLALHGATKRWRNVVIGAGHGMFGLTLAPPERCGHRRTGDDRSGVQRHQRASIPDRNPLRRQLRPL